MSDRISQAPKRILFVEVNEDGTVGGSHQAQFGLIRHVDRRRFCPIALYYQENRFANLVRKLNVEAHVWEQRRRLERAQFLAGSKFTKIRALFGAIHTRVRFLRRERIDLVYMNNSPLLGYDDWLPAALWARVPYITHMRGVGGYGFGPPRNVVKRFLFRSHDHVIAISEHITQAAHRLGFPKERVSLVYDGIDIEDFTQRVTCPAEEVRRVLDVSRNEIMIAMVGHIREWKGQAVVLAGLEKLDSAVRSRLRVFFVGGVSDNDKEFYGSLKERVKWGNLEGCVTFLGERTDVPDIMNAADIVLHASLVPEPFGLVIVEGMALGKTVVAAKQGGPAEIITPKCGVMFDTDKPEELARILTEVIENPGMRESLGRAARERAKYFSVEKMVNGVEQVYAEVLGMEVLSRAAAS